MTKSKRAAFGQLFFCVHVYGCGAPSVGADGSVCPVKALHPVGRAPCVPPKNAYPAAGHTGPALQDGMLNRV